MRSQQTTLTQEQAPLGQRAALTALIRCVVSTARLLRRRRVHLPTERVGLRYGFADGTSARVYRDTVVDRGPTQDPCVLVVEFRLRLVRGWGHAVFRWESLFNTPLFVGFPGFVSKLWMTCDETSGSGWQTSNCRTPPSRTRRWCGRWTWRMCSPEPSPSAE